MVGLLYVTVSLLCVSYTLKNCYELYDRIQSKIRNNKYLKQIAESRPQDNIQVEGTDTPLKKSKSSKNR